LSIEAQLAELREFAKQNNLFIVREYTESKTAKEPGREIFNQMLSEIEKGNAEGILAWNPDRLARNSVDGGRVIYLVDTLKIRSLKFPTFWLCKPVDNEKEPAVSRSGLFSFEIYCSLSGALTA
jgi:site-specific DNA recombinase